MYGKVGGRSEELSSHRGQPGARTHRYYFLSTRPEYRIAGYRRISPISGGYCEFLHRLGVDKIISDLGITEI